MSETSTLPRGEWHRAEAGDRRAPCPALNALANGGYVPRDGRVTAKQLVDGLKSRLGITWALGAPLVAAVMRELGKPGPDGEKLLDLSDLTHSFLEHAASLTRRDPGDPEVGKLVERLFAQLLSLSRDGVSLTREDLVVAHQVRMAQTAASGRPASVTADLLGTVEVAVLFHVLERDGKIALADAAALLHDERIPAHIEPRGIGPVTVFATAAVMVVEGNVTLFEAARRAKKAVHDLVEAPVSRCPVAHGGAASKA